MARMEVEDGMHAGHRQGIGYISGDAGALQECLVIH